MLTTASRPPRFEEPIYVTRPLFPPREAMQAQLDDIWESKWLSNGGPKHHRLEGKLLDFLKVPHLSLFCNGTIALLTGCHALRLTGEVITTPFTFPATPHCLSWMNITPVFCDVDDNTLTLDPRRIESLITPKTTGILGVHVYGFPCEVESIREIASRYGLKVIYDAAHAFGTEIEGRGIGEFGDLTMFSFHPTKLFHTAEGGALATFDRALKERIDFLKNFGIKNEDEVIMAGLNGKMNELQAAIGLEVLKITPQEREKRKRIQELYFELLSGIPGIRIIDVPKGVTNSLQYFVVRINSSQFGVSRDALYERLKDFNIFARKYFHPLCSNYNCYRALPSAAPQALPVANRVAQEVLALPFYGGLDETSVHGICDAIFYTHKTA